MRLTRHQIEELVQILHANCDFWTARRRKTETLSREDYDVAIASGLLPPGIQYATILYSDVLSRLEAILTEEHFSGSTFDELKKEAAKFTPTSPYEAHAMEAARTCAGRWVSGLSDDIRNGVFQNLQATIKTQLNERIVRNIIGNAVASAIDKRRGAGGLAADLRRELKDEKYSMDYLSIAETELHDAFQRGYVTTVLNGEGKFKHTTDGLDTNVYIMTNPVVCRECNEAYNDPVTGNPRIFRLADLLANGDNSGIPEGQRNKGTTGPHRVRAVLPSHHSGCSCHIQALPNGYGFDDDGNWEIKDIKVAYPTLFK